MPKWPENLRFEAADLASPAAASRYCRRLATRHYENFLVGSLLLPRAIRPHFYHVYAFCRAADDLADESAHREDALRLLAEWRGALVRCLDEPADHPIFVALGETLRQFNLTREPFARLLDAFEQDQYQTRYQTFTDLLQYCQRSANPVGEIVLRLGRVDDAEALRLSDSVCTGLQLVNHWQDVPADLQRGRVYLPAEDLDRFGVTTEMLAGAASAKGIRPNARAAIEDLLRMEVDRAKQYLHAGRPIVARVPTWLAADVQLFIEGGLAAATAIERVKYDIWSGRPRVSRSTQARLVASAFASRLWGRFQSDS